MSVAFPRSRTAKPRTRVNLTETALRLAGQTALWRPLVEFDPGARHYARLASTSQFEAWLLTWLPGQGTAWHDHGGSAGAFVVLRGTLTEQHASRSPFAPPAIDPRARRLAASQVRSFGANHIHLVANDDTEPAVSLHVYAPALVEMNTYQPSGAELRLVRSERVGVDW